jgi:hypothetical protein
MTLQPSSTVFSSNDLNRRTVVLVGTMVTLRKTDFIHLKISGKVRTQRGCRLEISPVQTNRVIDKIPLHMKM